MTDLLTFIIPVRHPGNSKDWSLQIRNLQQTARSIANQADPGWRGIVVANTVANIPELPPQFEVERVEFPPNPQHERGGADLEHFYDMFRLDKGRRVLAGMLKARASKFLMIVDDDDFVSSRLSGFVAQNVAANGWVISDGLVWGDGGKLVYRHGNFNNFCGTSHIIRTDLYEIPASFEAASVDYIKRMLGSHRSIDAHLAAQGTPLQPLPFPGAIYRIGHAGAHSRSGGILPTFLFTPGNLLRPHHIPHHLSRIGKLSKEVRSEFFGPGPTHSEALVSDLLIAS